MNSRKSDRARRPARHATPGRKADPGLALTIAGHSGQADAVLTRRIHELDREWYIERLLKTNAPKLALLRMVFRAVIRRRWLALMGGVLGFLALRTAQRRCPPLPLFRRLGLRTRAEVERERFALKFLRGDFDRVRLSSGKMNVPALVHALER